MFYNSIKFALTLVSLTAFLVFYTLFALIFSHKITDFINTKNKILSGIIYLSILILFLYLIQTYVLKKLINHSTLYETAFVMVGPIISVFSILSKDSHIKQLIKTIFDYVQPKMKFIHLKRIIT